MRCKIDFNFDKNKFKISDEGISLSKTKKISFGPVEKNARPEPRQPTKRERLPGRPDFQTPQAIRPHSRDEPRASWEPWDEHRVSPHQTKTNRNFNLKQTNLEITDMPDAVDELNSPVASPLIRRASKRNDGFALNVQAMG
jgi:hypothetical protein